MGLKLVRIGDHKGPPFPTPPPSPLRMLMGFSLEPQTPEVMLSRTSWL